ncbi:conserved hypothetical protein [Ricinus communis]|uniref:Uncharacterized protein n=1 Tax=Ricinus communis TaxID=3988 RepID=B9SYL6_RICCO|nr:conserved hypothetical protein [Ricinus communis]
MENSRERERERGGRGKRKREARKVEEKRRVAVDSLKYVDPLLLKVHLIIENVGPNRTT